MSQTLGQLGSQTSGKTLGQLGSQASDLLTSGTLDSPTNKTKGRSKPKSQPTRSKSHGHSVLVKNDSYSRRLTPRLTSGLTARPIFPQQSTSLISSIIDHQKTCDGKVFTKSNSWGEINATREEPLDKKPEAMVIPCDICSEEFLDNKDQILYCFPNYCDMCKKMHNDLLMEKVDRREIYTNYKMEVIYLAAKHTHEGECDDPEDCKITFHQETKRLPLLRYFKKQDRDLRDCGRVKDLHDDRMKYYRRPIEYSCKCHHCVTFYIIIEAKIVKI